MATLFTSEKYQVIGPNGPIPGAQVFTYAAGTLTPLATYTDQGGASPNTNPVIMGADGRASIWLGASTYRFRVYDSVANGGALIDDVDNIISSGSEITGVYAALADKADATKGGGMIGWRPSLNYAAGTIGKALSDRVWSITDYPFLAVGDDSTDNYAAILAAQAALSAAGGGTLLIPEGTFRILTAIPRVPNVDFVGLGWYSILKPVGCSAFTYAFLTGFGRSKTSNMWISGSSGSAQVGIYQAGTLNDADELYGMMIEGCAITGFGTAIQFRTVRNATIKDCWIQDCANGISLVGKCLDYVIHGVVAVQGAGAAGGNGINIDAFNYTSGTGSVRPEGIVIDCCSIFGFTTGVRFAGVVYGVLSNTVSTSFGVAVSISTVSGLQILNNYLQANGAAATHGIKFPAQGALLNTKVNIKNNNINAAGTAAGASIGIELGTYGVGGMVDGLTIEDNEFSGFTFYDIRSYFCGNNHIKKNRCLSSGTTQSMQFVAGQITRPTKVGGNDCAKLISFDPAEVGLILGTNVESGTVVNKGGTQTLTGAGAVALIPLRTNIVSTGANALTLADGYEGQEKFLVMKTDGGDATLTPANLYNGNTLTFNDVGDSAHLIFMDGQWVFVGGTATLA